MQHHILTLSFILMLTPGTFGKETECNKCNGNPVEVGAFGMASIDDGEFNLFFAAQCDWDFWNGVFIHYNLAFDEKHNSFYRIINTAGVGYKIRNNKLVVPIWAGGGFTTTGLWSRTLNRPFGSIGLGLRYYIVQCLGMGFNTDFAMFGQGVFENRFSIGLFFSPQGRQ